MDSSRISVPLRASNLSGKKMRKRRELDALVASNGMKRFSAYNGGPVCVKPGTNYHDQLLSESTDDQEDYWRSRNKAAAKRNRSTLLRRRCSSVLNVCTIFLVFGCVMITSTVLWLFLDIKHQANYLHNEMNSVVQGNHGMTDKLRQCQMQATELQRNQSEMTIRINSLTSQLNNLSKEILQISNDLKSVQSKLNSSSELSNSTTSINSKEISNWISTLNDTVAELKQSENRMQDGFHTLSKNVTSLKEKLSSQKVPTDDGISIISKDVNSHDFQQIVDKLNYSFTYLNTSLNNEINSIKHSQDHHMMEIIQSYLNQTVYPGLTNLTEEYSQFAALPFAVKNLTEKFESMDLKLKSLTEEIKSLNETNKTDKIDIPATTNASPVSN